MYKLEVYYGINEVETRVYKTMKSARERRRDWYKSERRNMWTNLLIKRVAA